MTNLDSTAVGCGGALVAVLGWLWLMRRRLLPGVPPELRGAQLAYAERLFRSSGFLPITARVDRAYRGAAGLLVLIELKTRGTDQVYLSDVIELSAQRVALMAETGEVVADYAFVLTEAPDSRPMSYHRVVLIGEAAIEQLVTKRHELIRGNSKPTRIPNHTICQECAFRRRCYLPSDR